MDERQQQILQDCESFGEDTVRHKLSSGEYPGSQDKSLVEGWLRDLESKREEELEKRREAREEESLIIAKQAFSMARKHLYWAIIATIMAAIAIIIATIAARDDIKWLISWLIGKLKTS